MNIFKKLLAKLRKQNNNDKEPWYNDKTNAYDPRTGTPNGEAYISPNSVNIQIANTLKNK